MIDVSLKTCPICTRNKNRVQGTSLMGHTIPEKARKRFILSSESILNGDNLIQRYERSLSQSTKGIAIRSIMRFCWIVHKTPKELMSMDLKELRKLLDDFETFFLGQYKNPNPTVDFEKIIPRNQCRAIASSVKGFLKRNEIGFTDKQYEVIFENLFALAVPKQKHYVPTKEDLRKAYSHVPESSKILIHFLTNVPLRRTEALKAITWNKIGFPIIDEQTKQSRFISSYIPIYDKVREGLIEKSYPEIILEAESLKGHGNRKYKNTHFVAIICESLRKALIELRQKERERFRQNGIIISEDEFNNLPIFLSSDTTTNNQGQKEIRPLEFSALGNVFFMLQKRTKIPLSCHSFRYYVQGVCDRMLGKDSVFALFFLGHKLPTIKASYDLDYLNYDLALENFKKIEPYVDLFYDENKIEDKLKMRFTQLKTEGKTDSEALDTIFKERSQMLVQEMNSFKGVILGQIEKSEEEHKRRTKE
jgi:hypothetical protein